MVKIPIEDNAIKNNEYIINLFTVNFSFSSITLATKGCITTDIKEDTASTFPIPDILNAVADKYKLAKAYVEQESAQ